jgi:hypothetical protein
MNLARPFKAGKSQQRFAVTVATSGLKVYSIVATRRQRGDNVSPALKRRAKFISTLRVETLDRSFLLACGGDAPNQEFIGHYHQTDPPSMPLSLNAGVANVDVSHASSVHRPRSLASCTASNSRS